jgi:hypothetical protein
MMDCKIRFCTWFYKKMKNLDPGATVLWFACDDTVELQQCYSDGIFEG